MVMLSNGMVRPSLKCLLACVLVVGLGGVVGCNRAKIERTELPSRGQIEFPKDVQPDLPDMPEIGMFLDMPGTNGRVEFTRISGPSIDAEATHSYSRRSAIDPFSKYVMLTDSILRLSDFRKITNPPFSYEYVPANTEENVFFGWVGNELRKWNVKTDEFSVVWIAPGECCFTIGNFEGGISLKDEFVVVTWDDASNIAVVDLKNGVVVGQTSSTLLDGKLNWVDISPLGNYVVVGTSTGVFRYDPDFTNPLMLSLKSTGDAHADLLLDKNGNEVLVQEGNYHDGDISYTDLENNTLHILDVVATNIIDDIEYPNAAAHISGQAQKVPGRVLVSLQASSGLSSMFTVDLEPYQSNIKSWGHSYTKGDTYKTEAKATISSDGTMIVWTSNWMQGDVTYEFLARIK